MSRLLALFLLCAACGDDPPPAPVVSDFVDESEPPPKGPAVKGGDTHKLGPGDSGKQKSIIVGDRVIVELEAASPEASADNRFRWGDPKVTGDALRLVNREERTEGGLAIVAFEMRAMRAGRASLTIPVEDKGAKARATDFAHEFTVALPD